MPTVLITGANRGIGLELARQYAAEGWRVIATCRNPGAADALNGIEGDIDVYPLDVDDPATLTALATSLKGQEIDVLFNNAGININKVPSIGDIDYDAWDRTMRTAPLFDYGVAAFANVVSSVSQYASLHFISFRPLEPASE